VSRIPRSLFTPAIGLVIVNAWVVLAVTLDARAVEPNAGPGERPVSMVVIYTDDQRESTLDVMSKTTSWLTRMPNGMVTNPVCCPSRASLLTGQWSHNNGVWHNSGPTGGWLEFEPHEDSTVATWLDAAGYRTGLLGKYMNGYGDDAPPGHVPPGWDVWSAYLRSHYEPNRWTMNVNGQRIRGDTYASHDLEVRASDFITTTPPSEPLFLLLAPYVPHRPTIPEPAYATAFDALPRYRNRAVNEANVADKPRWIRELPELSREELRSFDEIRQRQHETLLSTDDLVDTVMTSLQQAGRLDDTLVVFMSDNAFLWNEHRVWGKGAPYDGVVRVPLAMHVPEALGGQITNPDDLILNIDLAPTAAALAGVEPQNPVDGRPFLGRLDGTDPTWRSQTIIEHAEGGNSPAFCAARSITQLYVRYTTGEEEFYDYVLDPLELRNLARATPPGMRPLRRVAYDTCGPGSDARIPGFSW
jgi:N-acetylglucosamine-6-sulfatase